MPQPFNYTVDVQNPFVSAIQGYGMAQNMAMNQQKMQMMQDAARQQDLERQQAQQAMALKAEQQAQYKADQEAFLSKENKTAKDYSDWIAKYPQEREAYKESWNILNEEQKKNKFLEAQQIFTALKSGKPQIAKKLMTELQQNYQNSGQEQEAKSLEMMLQNFDELDPEGQGIMESLSRLMAAVDPGKFQETFDTAEKIRREQQMQPGAIAKQKKDLVKMGADIGLTQAQTLKYLADIKNLNFTMQKDALELEALKKNGGLTPEKKFGLEDKLRTEYVNRTKNYSEIQQSYDKIIAGRGDNTGASDMAMIFAFMKMLDPGSVVRETEFAQAQNVNGLLSKLQAAYNSAENGTFLTTKARKDYIDLAKKYMDAAEKHEKRIRDDIGVVVKNYGLNDDNVFGLKASSSQQSQMPNVTSQADYDALPSGALFMEDGKQYRKP